MGTRRKKPITVYLDPDSPLFALLAKMADKSTEGAELMEIGFRVRYGAQEASSPGVVTVTNETVIVTPAVNGVERATSQTQRVTVTKDEKDPGWDE